MKPGLYPAMPRAEYEAIDAANYSTLKHFNLSPAHAREIILHPPEPTEAMEFGTAMHTAILEPQQFAGSYVQAPKFDRRTTAGKAAWIGFEAQHPGRNYLKPEEWDNCAGIMKAIETNETATLLLRGEGANEISAVWTDPDVGILCKGRLDRFTSLYGWSVVVDVKTTDVAHPSIFPTHAARMGYHIQAAFYLDALAALAPADRRFVTLAIERDRPHGMMAYEYDEQAIVVGRNRYKTYLKIYAECRKTGIWPTYDSGIEPLTLPAWATRELNYD